MIEDLDPSGNMAYILGPKLGLANEDEEEQFYVILTVVCLISTISGAVAAGFLKQFKRRPILLVTCTLSIGGIFLASFCINKYIYILGYVMNYFSIGCNWVVTAKFMEEVVPENMLGVCYSMTILMGWFGSVIAGFFVDVLPSAGSPEQVLLENRSYQILICIPMVFGGISMIALFTWVDHESPIYYISTGQKDLALKTLSKYYYGCPELAFQELSRSTDIDKSNVTLSVAFTSPKYRRASLIVLGTLFFLCLNG